MRLLQFEIDIFEVQQLKMNRRGFMRNSHNAELQKKDTY